jgi:hypothetical protein
VGRVRSLSRVWWGASERSRCCGWMDRAPAAELTATTNKTSRRRGLSKEFFTGEGCGGCRASWRHKRLAASFSRVQEARSDSDGDTVGGGTEELAKLWRRGSRVFFGWRRSRSQPSKRVEMRKGRTTPYYIRLSS